MFLQVAVFLQPLLPEQFQISRVCITIAELSTTSKSTVHSMHQMQTHDLHQQNIQSLQTSSSTHDHTLDHHCMFCTVYGHLIANLNLEIKEVFERLQIRLLTFQKAFKHVFFVLQRLFLSPQGRAPPLFA
ncbi:hypothetical protein XA39_01805 [Acinetobacter tandoii]|nr:hypothetical protein XA39_01805 [Acinetobacter tandoii]